MVACEGVGGEPAHLVVGYLDIETDEESASGDPLKLEAGKRGTELDGCGRKGMQD